MTESDPRFQGLRKAIEDFLAPTLSRLERDVHWLGKKVDELAAALRINVVDLKELSEHVRDRMSNVDRQLGRFDGVVDGMDTRMEAMKTEVFNEVMVRLASAPVRGSGPHRLTDSTE